MFREGSCSSCEHGIQVVLRQLAEHHHLCWEIYHAQRAPAFDGVRLLVCTHAYLTKLSTNAVGGEAGRVWGRRHRAVLIDEVDECTIATLLAGTRKGAEVLAGYDPRQKLECLPWTQRAADSSKFATPDSTV